MIWCRYSRYATKLKLAHSNRFPICFMDGELWYVEYADLATTAVAMFVVSSTHFNKRMGRQNFAYTTHLIFLTSVQWSFLRFLLFDAPWYVHISQHQNFLGLFLIRRYNSRNFLMSRISRS